MGIYLGFFQDIPLNITELLITGLQQYPVDAPRVDIVEKDERDRGLIAWEYIQERTSILPYEGDVITHAEFQKRNQDYIANG